MVFAAGPVPVMKNGLKPVGTPMEMVFTEELVFGSEEDNDAYIWGSTATSFDVDARGHIFVSDVKNSLVHEFDANGKLVGTIVNKGQGPGEAQNLASYQLFDDGTAFMLESGFGLPRVTWFAKDGTPNAKMLQVQDPMPQGIRFDSTGKYAYGLWVNLDLSSGTMNLQTGILDNEFKQIKLLSDVQRPAPSPETFSTPEKAAQQIGGNIKSVVSGSGVGAFSGNGYLYTGLSTKYEITKYSVEDLSTPLMVITKEYKPIPMPEEETDAIVEAVVEGLRATPLAPLVDNDAFKMKAKEAAEMPSTFNAMGAMAATEDGHLLVLRKWGFSVPEITADVFNPEGQFIGTAKWDSYASGTGFNTPMIFKNGKAYTMLRDEMGELRIARFSYKLAKK
jgi:hypothetical protein